MISPGALKDRSASFQRGFTLLEVMIALAIIAIALTTLLGLSNRSLGINSRLQRVTQATLLAQQRMTEIEYQAAQPGFQFEEKDGVFEKPFEEYRWRIEYEESPLPALRLIKVTVAWGEEANNEMVDLTSFVLVTT